MNGLEHRRLAGMNISAGGHAEASLKCCGEVGDDIAEHVVGDDYIEAAGIAHHLQAERVHVHVLGFNLKIFRGDLFEYALPEAAGVGHGVGFVAHQHTLARRAVELGVALAVFEGVADDPLDSLSCIDVLLRGDFVGSSLLEGSAGIGVNAFGVFADHDEVDVFGLDAF
jgi:hypothetical protein